MVFRCLVCRRPDIVAGEIDVLPPERGQVGEKVIGNILGLAQGGDRALRYRVFQRMMAVTRRLRPEARCCWFS